MKTFLKILKYLFLVWGVFTFGIALLLGVFFFSGFYAANVAHTDKASQRDVRFVLNWCRLGDERITQVVHSYESTRSFTGDHLDACAILISHVEESELSSNDDWTRGDRASRIHADAVRLATGFARLEKRDWFPKEEDLLSENYYLYTWKINQSRNRVTAAQLIFVNPVTKMVYYASVKI